jgi:hypothetical protein
MCEICDGASDEAMFARYTELIRAFGFMVMTVDGGGGPGGGWSYTIGLLDSADHPELIVVGGEPQARALLVQGVAIGALDGEHYHVGDTIDLGESRIARVGTVHPIHFELETFAIWQNLADIGAIHRHEPRAVQLLLPTALLDGAEQPLLADPNARVGNARRLDRAERRAHRRRRRH